MANAQRLGAHPYLGRYNSRFQRLRRKLGQRNSARFMNRLYRQIEMERYGSASDFTK